MTCQVNGFNATIYSDLPQYTNGQSIKCVCGTAVVHARLNRDICEGFRLVDCGGDGDCAILCFAQFLYNTCKQQYKKWVKISRQFKNDADPYEVINDMLLDAQSSHNQSGASVIQAAKPCSKETGLNIVHVLCLCALTGAKVVVASCWQVPLVLDGPTLTIRQLKNVTHDSIGKNSYLFFCSHQYAHCYLATTVDKIGGDDLDATTEVKKMHTCKLSPQLEELAAADPRFELTEVGGKGFAPIPVPGIGGDVLLLNDCDMVLPKIAMNLKSHSNTSRPDHPTGGDIAPGYCAGIRRTPY